MSEGYKHEALRLKGRGVRNTEKNGVGENTIVTRGIGGSTGSSELRNYRKMLRSRASCPFDKWERWEAQKSYFSISTRKAA